ncbi:MAG: glucose-6-phosphate isomerase [Pseudomonadota bacterium]
MMTQTSAWQTLAQYYQQSGKSLDTRQLFADDLDRFNRFSLSAADLFFDFSKHRIDDQAFKLLLQLAETCHLSEKIDAMFSGAAINVSENRPVLHTALRCPADKTLDIDGEDIIPAIHKVLAQMRHFSEQLRAGHYVGATGKAITDVVNISIGGSHLGPQMLYESLKAYSDNTLRCHFVSNIDATDIVTTLAPLNPETTLFIIGSKSFTTIETLVNANSAKQWLCAALGDQAFSKHFVALSSNPQAAAAFGIAETRIFPFWSWVGGRYSVWSSIGLIVMLAIGADHFDQLLAGAFAMDQHFRQTDFDKNMPVIMALLGIWYHNFFAAETHAVVCYDQYLQLFPRYLQQLDMESNGKSVRENGQSVTSSTGPIIWGDCGTNSQHSFHQLLHQGTHLVPIDFILAANSLHPLGQHHQLLLANALAQSQALLMGKNETQAYEELIAAGMSATQAKTLAAHKVMPGNRPSSTIMMEKLTPYTLGALIAAYEHKVFVQGVIWGIDSFDQWGVELGKVLAKNILPQLTDHNTTAKHDASTQGLINYCRSRYSQ